MQISINLPFDELLTVIKKLNPNEKKEIAKQELKKVFFLASNGVDVKMFSKFIDSIWHELLKDKNIVKEIYVAGRIYNIVVK